MRRLPFGIAVAALLSLLAPPDAAAQRSPAPSRCGVAIPDNEMQGYVPLPLGDVFCPLIADPKGVRSFVSYLRETSDAAEVNVGSVGLGDNFGLLRWGGPGAGDGLQLSLSGSVFAQFDLDTPSVDLLNADYVIALPLTYRRGTFSARARVYHQSSHLGDEFLLRGENPERENLSFEAVELILARDLGPLRVYGGGEYLFNREPADLAASVAHTGLEFRPSGGIGFGRLGAARPIAAVDVKASEEQDWKPAVSARAGFDFGRPGEALESGGRWSLLFEFYDGPSPYGQFYRNKITALGAGLHFTIR